MSDDDMTALIAECVLAVRAAEPPDLEEARFLTRVEFAERDVFDLSLETVEAVAKMGIAKNPAAAEVSKTLRASRPSNSLQPPTRAIDMNYGTGNDELLTYPQVDVDTALPVFERLLRELPEQQDSIDSAGPIPHRQFDARLELDSVQRVAVHIGTTVDRASGSRRYPPSASQTGTYAARTR